MIPTQLNRDVFFFNHNIFTNFINIKVIYLFNVICFGFYNQL